MAKDADYKVPTKADIKLFKSACNDLVILAKKGLYIYLAEDTMCLMAGPSHDDEGEPRQHAVHAEVYIPRSGGGDW